MAIHPKKPCTHGSASCVEGKIPKIKVTRMTSRGHFARNLSKFFDGQCRLCLSARWALGRAIAYSMVTIPTPISVWGIQGAKTIRFDAP